MDEIEKLVSRASRRLTLSTLLNRFAWAILCAVSAFAVYLLVERTCYLGLDVELIGIALAAIAVAISVLLTMIARTSRVHAAIEVDLRASLRSRIATALELGDDSSPMAVAVQEDAAAHSRRVDLGKCLPIVAPRRAMIALLPAVVVLLAIWSFVPQCDLLGRREKEIQAAKEKEEIAKRAEELKTQIEKLEKAAEIENLEMAQKLVDEVKTMADDMAESEDKAEALAKLADMAEDLKARREPAEELKKTLDSLQDFAEGEVTKDLANSLKAKDMKQAAQAMRELQEKLKEGKLSEKDLKKMAEELAKLAEMCKGDEKMCKALEDLAKSLMTDKELALENFKQMLGELKDMEKMLAEMEMMDLALAELSECKGKLCGEGLASLAELRKQYAAEEGEGEGEGMKGPGTGKGGVSEDGTDAGTDTSKTRVRGQLDEGEILGSIFVKGTPKKGQALVEYSEVVRSAKDAAADALSKEEIPQGYKGLIKGYFDSIDPGRIPKAGEKKPAAGANEEKKLEGPQKP